MSRATAVSPQGAAEGESNAVSAELGQAVRHTAIYGIGGLLVKALGFLMLPFYTHYLTPKDYGILEILDLSLTLFGMILQMGMTPAFLRCYAAVSGEDEKKRVVSTACLFGVVTAALTFTAGAPAISHLSARLFGPDVPSYYLMTSFASAMITYAANLPRTYLRALEASAAFTIVDTATVGLLLCLNVLFIAVLKLGLMGILLSTAVVAVLQIVFLAGWAFGRVGFGFSMAYLRRMLSFGLPLIAANLGLFVLNFSDRFFLQRLQSLDAVGVYSVGYKFGYMVNYLLVQPFLIMWQTRMYAIYARPEHPKIYRQFFLLYTLLLTYAGLGMSLFSREFIRIMVTSQFSGAADVIPIIVLAYVFYGTGYFAQVGMMVTDRTKAVGAVGAASAVLNLALNYWLIRRYGMMGAGWATALSFLAIAVGSYIFSQRTYRMDLAVHRVVAVLLLGMAFYLPGVWLAGTPLWTAVTVKAVLMIVFPVLISKSGLLSVDERATLQDGWKSVSNRLVGLTGLASRRLVGE